MSVNHLLSFVGQYALNVFVVSEPRHDKTNKKACAPSKGSDQPRHPPSLIRVFAVRLKGSSVPTPPSCRQRKF